MRDEVARLAATKAIEIARSAVKQRGATGPKGDRGHDGKDGEPGPQGKPGKDGRDGYDGKDGLPGQNGRNGADGKNGLPGKDGRDGLNGKDGAKGPKGDKGDRGDKGPEGKQGETGPMPKHQKKGLMIRFESSPGTWGEWIVMPTAGGGGGGGRDDKLTDRQKELVEVADDRKAGAVSVYIQDVQPNFNGGKGLWLQTGIGVGGADWTIWFEDGQ